MMTDLLKWVGISITAGVAFNVLWAVVFWNNDSLYMWHWLGVPIAAITMAVGFVRTHKHD